MGVALDNELGKYEQAIRNAGSDSGTAQALVVGFVDGFQRGHKVHASITAQALEALEREFQEPVSIKSARERVQQLRLAIQHGSEL